jgi:sulfofructose kinase
MELPVPHEPAQEPSREPDPAEERQESRRATVLCVGIAVVDVVAHARGELVPGVKQFAERMETTFGGPATTAAVAASRLGVDAELVAATGDDEHGAQLRKALSAHGVHTGGMPVREGVATATSLVVVTPDGERTIVNATDPALRAPLDPDEARRLIARAGAVDVVLVDIRWPAAAALALAAASRAGIPGVLDLDLTDPEQHDRVRGLARAASHVVASHDALYGLLARDGEHRSSSDLDDPAVALDALAAIAGDGMVAVTLGADGVIWRDADGTSGVAAPPPVVAVETLGAGDVWHGAFAAALARRVGVDRAVIEANVAAALRVSRTGGWGALADLDEVAAVLDPRRRPGGTGVDT